MNQQFNTTYSPNPLLPAANRQTYDIDLQGKTLQNLLDELPYETHRLDVFASVNDELVPRADWTTHNLKQGDIIVLKQRLHGGDSNPLQIIATIALIAFAAWAGPAAAGAMGLAGTTATVTGSIITATIMVGGTLLLNAIFPPAFDLWGDDDKNNYSIGGGRNRARPYQPLPLVVGTHRVHPDLGAQPYTTQLRDGEVYLHQVFNFGFGDLEITDLKIGETDILEHTDIQLEWNDGVGHIELFPTNVDSLAGGQLTEEIGWVTRTSSLNTTKLVVDFVGILFTINTKGETINNTWFYQIQYRAVESEGWIGWDTATPLFKLVYQDLDWENGESLVVSAKTSPLRRTFAIDVPQGQYEVRIRQSRPDPRVKNYQRTKEMQWTQLRSYQPDDGDYSNQTRLAVEVRASGQFNGTLDTVNAIVSAKIPVWDFDTEEWVIEESSNPAFIYLYLARGAKDSNGKRLWGAVLNDSRIDIGGILEWAQWCDQRGLECNYVFDQALTIMEMLVLVARTGRGSPSWQKGVLGAVYDREGLPITQVFGMGNIVQETFNVQYITENLADEIVVRFVNKDIDYQFDEVSSKVPGIIDPINRAEVDLPGITNSDQAGREANLIAARQYFNRRRVSFETDIEGLVCSRGDVISISHDLTSWGASGRLSGGTTTTLQLTREVIFYPATSYWVGVRYPNGEYYIRSVTNPATIDPVTTTTLNLASALPSAPDADPLNSPHDYIFLFDPNATPGRKLKVTGIQPVSENRVALVCVDEVEAYYDAEGGEFTYIPPNRYNQTRSRVLDIEVGETFRGPTQPLLIDLRWGLDNAFGAGIRIRINNGSWTNLATVSGTSHSFDYADWQDGDQLDFEFTPLATAAVRSASVITTFTYFVNGLAGVIDDITIPPVTGLELFGQGNETEFTGRDAKFVWRRTAAEPVEFGSEDFGAEQGSFDDTFEDYEVRIFGGDGTLKRVEHTTVEEYIYNFEKNAEDHGGEASRFFTIAVYVRATNNKISRPANLSVSNPPPPTPQNLEITSIRETLVVSMSTPQDLDFVGMVIHASTTQGFNPAPANRIHKGAGTSASVNTLFAFDIPVYIRVAGYDGFSATQLNFSSEQTITFEGIKADEIAAEAINDPGMFATNIRPIEIVAVLPVTGNFDGRMAFLTTDGKVYRYFDGEWTTAVATADLSGTVDLNSQISGQLTSAFADAGLINSNITINADGTLSNAGGGAAVLNQLQGQIAAGQIAANAVVAGTIDALAITAGTIAAGAVTTNTMTANTINGDRILAESLDANKITANSITAGQIQAGAIGADEIAARSIAAEKLLIGAFNNLIENSDFAAVPQFAGWARSNLAAFNIQANTASPVPAGAPQGLAIVFTEPTNTARHLQTETRLRVLPDERYFLSYWIARNFTVGTITHRTEAVFFNNTGATLSTVAITPPTAQGATTWTKYTGQVLVPTGAVEMIIRFVFQKTTPSPFPTVWFANPRLTAMARGELIVDGAITAAKMAVNSITADNGAIANLAVTTAKIADLAVTNGKIASLNAGKITAGTINAALILGGSIVVNPNGFIRSGQTAYNTGNGWWLGRVGTESRLSIGNGTDKYLRWTGNELETNKLVVTGGLIVDTPLERTAMKIHTGGGRLAPFNIVDYGMHGNTTGQNQIANRTVELTGFTNFNFGSGWNSKRFAWARMDVMCEVHIMAAGNPETFEFQRRYNGGTWIGVFQHNWNSSSRGSYHGVWRFTTQDIWNNVDFRVITTEARTLSLMFRVTINNTGSSINTMNSFSSVSGATSGGSGDGGGGPGGVWNLF